MLKILHLINVYLKFTNSLCYAKKHFNKFIKSHLIVFKLHPVEVHIKYVVHKCINKATDIPIRIDVFQILTCI